MPCGTSRVVSTTPATRSLTSQRRRYPTIARNPGGTSATAASGTAAEPAARLAHSLLDQDRHERADTGVREGRVNLHCQAPHRPDVEGVLRGEPDDEGVEE